MGMPGPSFPLACTQFSPAHLISSIIHYLFTEELSGHPIHPYDFSCATLACKVLNSCRAATPSLGKESEYTLWQLSQIFSRIPRWLTKLQTFKEKDTPPSPVHANGRTKAHSWNKNTGIVPWQQHLLPMWSPPSLSATAPLPALVHVHVVFNCQGHLLKKFYVWLQTDPWAVCDPGEAWRPC